MLRPRCAAADANVSNLLQCAPCDQLACLWHTVTQANSAGVAGAGLGCVRSSQHKHWSCREQVWDDVQQQVGPQMRRLQQAGKWGFRAGRLQLWRTGAAHPCEQEMVWRHIADYPVGIQHDGRAAHASSQHEAADQGAKDAQQASGAGERASRHACCLPIRGDAVKDPREWVCCAAAFNALPTWWLTAPQHMILRLDLVS